MLKEKKFFYKARRTDDYELVIGRVGTSCSINNEIEETTYFNEYVGDKCDNANWSSCTVFTHTIVPIE